MSNCLAYSYCGLDDSPEEGRLCILHSIRPEKDKNTFISALENHRKQRGDNFEFFYFPDGISFSEAVFEKNVTFTGATFSGEASFSNAMFSADADFSVVTFMRGASFSNAKFMGPVAFWGSTFKGRAIFWKAAFSSGTDFHDVSFFSEAIFMESQMAGLNDFKAATFWALSDFRLAVFNGPVGFLLATFHERAVFYKTTFTETTQFVGVKFGAAAEFEHTVFDRGEVSFDGCTFQGRSRFTSPASANPIFAGVRVYFTDVYVEDTAGVIFRNADLRKSTFLDTDMCRFDINDVVWPRIGRRIGAYDEIVAPSEPGFRAWERIERLYRELKQNYEERHDYERAGDFHYGEKEMRRRNPTTPAAHRLFLTSYWLSSGYGEMYLRPLIWASFFLFASTFGYLVLGLRPKDGGSALGFVSVWDWLQALHYSFRAMTLLKPDDLVPLGNAAVILTIQSLLGPLLLGLFALALRQRLKR